MVDVNGPTLHIFPRAFRRPLFSVHLSKVMVVGHLTVPLPLQALEVDVQAVPADAGASAQAEFAARFPTAESDFVGKAVREGSGRQATKLEIFVFPLTLHFLGEQTPPDALATFQVRSLDGPDDGGHNASDAPAGGVAVDSQIMAIGETKIGLHWDNTGSPQFILSLVCPTIEYDGRPPRGRKMGRGADAVPVTRSAPCASASR